MAALSANREMLAVLAGVFFMLPWLAFALFVPEPPLTEGMTPSQAVQAMAGFLRANAPWLILLGLVESVGALAVLALCADRTRPTVGEAIRRGAWGVPAYFAAVLLFALAFSFGAAILSTLARVGGSTLASLMAVAVNLALVYATVRLTMVAPVIALEGGLRPWRVLVRSWRLTRGNFGRLFLFLLLLAIASQVVIGVAGIVIGSIVTLVGGPSAGHIAEAIVSAACLAGFLLVMTSVLAAIHAQLAGPWAARDPVG